MASKNVDLPAPFAPTIKVAGLASSLISLKALPVERKFFQRIDLKIIIQTKIILLHKEVRLYHQERQHNTRVHV